MVTIVDGHIKEQDIEPYRKRIVVSDERKSEIYSWVAARERELEECPLNPREFERLMQSFMRRAAYTENLLNLPYKASEDTLQKVAVYCDYLLPLRGDYWQINRAMYHVEKAIRIGADIKLGECDVETITALEGELFRAGEEEEHGRLVKMLSRHRVLGLSEPETEVKKCLEPLPSPLIFLDWLGCAALRAGLRLEPIYSRKLDRKIEVQVEQKQEKNFDLSLYVSGMHHLHRLLNPEPQRATE